MGRSRWWWAGLIALSASCGRDNIEPTDPDDQPLKFVTGTLPDGRVGASYSAPVDVDAETPRSLIWTQDGSGIPGVALQSFSGGRVVLAGVPTEAGVFEVRLRVMTGVDEIARTFFARVAPAEGPGALEIATDRLPDAELLVPYVAEVVGRFGSGAGYSWRVENGRLPLGLSLSPDGTPAAAITGVPTQAETTTFTVVLEDSDGSRADRTLSLSTRGALIPRIVTAALPIGQVNAFYTAALTTQGFTVEPFWVVEGLPDGLAIDNVQGFTINIQGTPVVGGDFPLSLTASDGVNEAQANLLLSISGSNGPFIGPQFLPTGNVGEQYLGLLRVTGGMPPYTWEFSGVPPPGLAFSAADVNAQVAGVPTQDGTFSFGIRVTDNRGDFDQRQYSIDVLPMLEPLVIETTVLDWGTTGEAYATTIDARGGLAPYSWEVSSGQLPVGLTLNPNGAPSTTITGTLGQRGQHNFTLRVTDQNGNQDTQAFMIFGDPPLAPLTIDTASLPTAPACSPHNEQIVASGGSQLNYLWQLGGSVPGLELDATGTPATRLSGVPTTEGTYPITVTVADSDGNLATRSYTVEITQGALGTRFVLLVGDLIDSAHNDVFAVNICANPPSTPRKISPPQSGGAGALADRLSVQLSPDGRFAAFIGEYGPGQNDRLYVFDLQNPSTTTTPIPVTPATGSGSSNTDFRWAPGSRAIAFNGQGGFFQARFSAGTWTSPQSISALTAQTYKFSFDSTKIAYRASGSGGVTTLYWADATTLTGGVVNAPTLNSSPVGPRFIWTRDSAALIYVAAQDTAGKNELYHRLVPDSAGNVGPINKLNATLNANGDVKLDAFELSSDGTQLIYLADTGSGSDELFGVNMAGPLPSSGVRLSPLLTMASRDVQRAGFAPNDTRVLFQGDLESSGFHELYVVDAALGGNAVKVSQQNMGAPPQFTDGVLRTIEPGVGWSPDGTQVAFRWRWAGRTELYHVFLTGMNPSTATRIDSTSSDPNLTPSNFRWSPNSQRIAIIGDLDRNARTELYSVDVSGTAPFPRIKVNPPLVGGGDVFGGLGDVRWHYDGTKLFYVADQDVFDVHEAFLGSAVAPSMTERLHVPLSGLKDVKITVVEPLPLD